MKDPIQELQELINEKIVVYYPDDKRGGYEDLKQLINASFIQIAKECWFADELTFDDHKEKIKKLQ